MTERDLANLSLVRASRRLSEIGARARVAGMQARLYAGDGGRPTTPAHLRKAAEWLTEGNRMANVNRRWPLLAARLRKLADE